MGHSADRSLLENEGAMPVEDNLYRLCYASTQTEPMSAAQLIALLHSARDRNRAKGITGVLLHRQDSFMQVIEGKEAAVLELFDKIKQDPRHQRVEVLGENAVEEREFSDWQMGFVELDEVDVSLLPGFSNFLNETDDSRTVLRRLSQTRRLMMLFKSLG